MYRPQASSIISPSPLESGNIQSACHLSSAYPFRSTFSISPLTGITWQPTLEIRGLEALTGRTWLAVPRDLPPERLEHPASHEIQSCGPERAFRPPKIIVRLGQLQPAQALWWARQCANAVVRAAGFAAVSGVGGNIHSYSGWGMPVGGGSTGVMGAWADL